MLTITLLKRATVFDYIFVIVTRGIACHGLTHRNEDGDNDI